jgi:hypothetical protein
MYIVKGGVRWGEEYNESNSRLKNRARLKTPFKNKQQKT